MATTALSTPSDEELVSAYAQRGDERAIRMLVERHQERVYGYLLGMVRDRTTADDLFQETFLRVLKALQGERAGYTRQGRFLGWVLRIARNAALDHLRSRKRWQDVDAGKDQDGSGFWDHLKDDATPVDHEIDQGTQRAWLRQAIEKLSPEQREVLLLRHEAELTFREIAALTDVSINTALGRMRYALLNLRRMMPAELEGIRP
ncbi:MAG: sigma-70 family RNA polymerase sigma factor [Rhodothermales bacterium]|nr:sigma-70 family RNA polymerase sigma factor [Rhodothermales bacterium]MBO6779540.1 sigma-70 family RNA polymerase sigma factor [Rhodothermales bacterium]